jgi:hypothetical protein
MNDVISVASGMLLELRCGVEVLNRPLPLGVQFVGLSGICRNDTESIGKIGPFSWDWRGKLG